jgi:hypothetical protein
VWLHVFVGAHITRALDATRLVGRRIPVGAMRRLRACTDTTPFASTPSFLQLCCCARPLTANPLPQAQKYSVQKQLRRRFQRFMAEQGDYNSLLLTILRNMVRDADRNAALAAGGLHEPRGPILVAKDRFEDRAQEYQINDVDAFYRSKLFSEHRFSFDEDESHIVMTR